MVTEALAVCAALEGRPGRVALLSGRKAEGLGHHSIATADPEAIICGRVGDVVVTEKDGCVSASGTDAYALISQRLAKQHGAVAIGYLGYEVGSTRHGVSPWPAGSQREPDVWFGIYSAYWLFDHERGEGDVRGCDATAQAALSRAIAEGCRSSGEPPELGELEATATVDEQYRTGFQQVADYLLAGDCYQVNLARRLTAPRLSVGDPLALFATLCRRNPEPYSAYIETGEHAVMSSSPERFLARGADSRRLETRPIKGTRARSGDVDKDAALAEQLTNNEKEAAEHLMIVDLERNDLGRVATIGSVRVAEFARVIELPTLLHMVSTVECELRDGVELDEILDATFPGGSITGAPKLRAMEIIRELEPVPRGVYTGAIGMLGPGDSIDLAIAIRTAVLGPTLFSLHVGGGLVADSTLGRELAETEEKARGWRRALDSA